MKTHPPLEWLPGTLVVYRLPPGATVDDPNGFGAIVRTPAETTLVRSASRPSPAAALRSSGPWAAFRVQGTIPHDATGVMARLSGALAEAAIPIFAISTFDTDYVLVPAGLADAAREALARAGYPEAVAP